MTEDSLIHVIDDDPAVRESLALLLETEGYAVRAYSSAFELLNEVTAETNGCVITDLRMPGLDGLDLLAEMKRRSVHMPVIVISARADVGMAVKAMKEGAVDFIEKPFSSEELFFAVRSAIFDHRRQSLRDEEMQAIKARLASLSGRESEVLVALLKGKPNKIIAHELGIGTRTVESHRAKIMSKMEAASLSELVRKSLIARIV